MLLIKVFLPILYCQYVGLTELPKSGVHPSHRFCYPCLRGELNYSKYIPKSLSVLTMLIFFFTSLILIFFLSTISFAQSHSICFRRAIHLRTSISSSRPRASFQSFSKLGFGSVLHSNGENKLSFKLGNSHDTPSVA